MSSYMQQKSEAPRMSVLFTTDAKKMLKELKDLVAIVRFRKLDTTATKIDVWTFSDSSFNIFSRMDYVQTGILMVMKADVQSGEEVFHLIDWKAKH